jgi:hypothetical protein
MPFTSPAFDDAKLILASAGHSPLIPVEPLVLATPGGWRQLGLLRVALIILYRRNPLYWLLWLNWRALANVLGACFPNSKLGDVLTGRRPGHELCLVYISTSLTPGSGIPLVLVLAHGSRHGSGNDVSNKFIMHRRKKHN